MIAIAGILAVNAAVLIACMLVLWLVCVRLEDVTVVDSFWALGMVIMAASTFVQATGTPARKALLLGLCALWGLRLGGYLIWRWRGHGPDRRYRTMLGRAQTEKGWSFARASLLLVFATQAPLLFIVSLPAQLGQISPTPPIWDPWPGSARRWPSSASSSKASATGSWPGSAPIRPPAGPCSTPACGATPATPTTSATACAWWGLWLIAAETGPGLWALSGPLLLTWTLIKWSGVPTVEGHLRKTRPGYAEYVARTSAFVPWPPKPKGV